MVQLGALSWDELRKVLLEGTSAPVVPRYKALFSVQQSAPSATAAVATLSSALPLQTDSVLLRHEAAYVLGQLGDASAIEPLRQILLDETEDEIVRHEAAEALAALRSDDSEAMVTELTAVAKDSCSEALRHTCQLALAGLEQGKREEEAGRPALPLCVCQYSSKDPAEGLANATEKDIPWAASRLADDSLPLFERYQGMFTLRNVGGDGAVESLAKMLLSDTSSAVLRHEVAFVLGQMADETSTKALVEALAHIEEHGMVRHEAAIALGHIGTESAEEALRQYSKDPDLLVAQSCEVALATIEYWKSWEELEARIAAGAEDRQDS